MFPEKYSNVEFHNHTNLCSCEKYGDHGSRRQVDQTQIGLSSWLIAGNESRNSRAAALALA